METDSYPSAVRSQSGLDPVTAKPAFLKQRIAASLCSDTVAVNWCSPSRSRQYFLSARSASDPAPFSRNCGKIYIPVSALR